MRHGERHRSNRLGNLENKTNAQTLSPKKCQITAIALVLVSAVPGNYSSYHQIPRPASGNRQKQPHCQNSWLWTIVPRGQKAFLVQAADALPVEHEPTGEGQPWQSRCRDNPGAVEAARASARTDLVLSQRPFVHHRVISLCLDPNSSGAFLYLSRYPRANGKPVLADTKATYVASKCQVWTQKVPKPPPTHCLSDWALSEPGSHQFSQLVFKSFQSHLKAAHASLQPVPKQPSSGGYCHELLWGKERIPPDNRANRIVTGQDSNAETLGLPNTTSNPLRAKSELGACAEVALEASSDPPSAALSPGRLHSSGTARDPS